MSEGEYGTGEGITGGELVAAVVLEVSAVVLVEAFEAVVEVDRGRERSVEGEADLAVRKRSIVMVVLVGRADVVVAQVDLLGGDGGLDQDKPKGDADYA